MSGIIIFNYSSGDIIIVKISEEEEKIINSYAFLEEYLSENWIKIGININTTACSWMWIDNIDNFIYNIKVIDI